MNNSTETPQSKGFPKLFIILASVFGAVLAVTIAALSIVIYASRPITVEVGSEFTPSRITDNKIISAVCSIDSRTAVDTSNRGDYVLSLKFFGVFHRNLHVFVRDTVPPKAEMYDVKVSCGTAVSAEDFVRSTDDLTDTSVSFNGNAPNTTVVGMHDISIAVTDTSGNRTEKTAQLEVTDESTIVYIEFGDKDCTDDILKIYPKEDNIDISEVNLEQLGSYTASSYNENTYHKFSVIVRDTVPPKARTVNRTLRMGDTVEAKDLVKYVSDATEVKIRFEEEIDFSEIGVNNVGIILEDESGNVTKLMVQIEVCQFNSDISLELGYTKEDLDAAVFGDKNASDYSMYYIGEVTGLGVGSHTIELSGGNDEDTTVTITVKDTLPPELVLKDISVPAGNSVSPEDFIESCKDFSEFELSFESDPDTDGTTGQTVTVIATDIYGNSSKADAKLTLLIDTTPPVIYGVKDLSIIYPYNISYVRGVYAEDETDGIVDVTVDSSAVNIEVNGVYTVKYTAVDSSGNKTEMSANVTVRIEGNSIEYPPATEPPATEPPATEPPATEPPATEPPATVPPATEPPATEPPATEPIVQPDTEPPVIYGIKDLSIVSPENISYVRGVYAEDNVDGSVEVTVDSSEVNIEVNGVYTVKYTAVDSSGNKTEKTANVTVNIVTAKSSAIAAADKILASITNSSMSPREKAYAIYLWSTSNLRYSTSTSYLMGQFYEGANSGFTIRRGNCYIYYSVTSVLLTRAGIENIEIQRDDPSNPHYWNLVKIDGSWYHLDTCPHFPGHTKNVFLWTDAQVRDYSQNEVSGYYSFNSALYPATP